MSEKRTCFVIAPIGESNSITRKRSDTVLNYIIRPAIEPLGFNVVRADQISEPGQITSQVIQSVIDSPLVIADLSERNPNVFYELALRHAVGKPLVQMIQAGETIPFDVANLRTVFYQTDLEGGENAKRELVRQVTAIDRADAVAESPILAAVQLKALRESGNAEQRTLANIMDAINELPRQVIDAMKHQMKNTFEYISPGFVLEISRHISALEKGPITVQEQYKRSLLLEKTLDETVEKLRALYHQCEQDSAMLALWHEMERAAVDLAVLGWDYRQQFTVTVEDEDEKGT